MPADAAIDSIDGTTISVDGFGSPPALVVYRDGTGAWQAPRVTPTGYELIVHGPYVVSSTCVRVNPTAPFETVATTQLARTADDITPFFIGCSVTDRPTVHVTGQMVQPGSVALGGRRQRSTTPNWSFDIEVPPGTYDVIALATDRIELRRDIAVTGATTLSPAFDVDNRGAALVPAKFTVSGPVLDDQVSALIALQTAHGLTLLEDASLGQLDKQRAVPTSVLRDTEFHKLLLTAFAFPPEGGPPAATRNLRRRWNPGQPTAFELPDRLGPISYAVTGSKLVATWTTVPDFYEVAARVSARTAGSTKLWSIDMTASRRFIDATSPSIAVDVEIPGFKPEWQIDYSKEYSRRLLTFTSRGATSDDRDECEATDIANAGQLP